MQHLLDFFDEYARGTSPALVYDDGFRRWAWSYDDLRASAEAFARRLTAAGLRQNDRLLIWAESRPEWVVAFWGAMLCGVTIVPVDRAATRDLARRIADVSQPRALLCGEGLTLEQIPSIACAFRLRDVQRVAGSAGARQVDAIATERRANVSPDTVAEIVFTSGTTGDPKGVLITHRNIVANIAPIEREAAAYRRYLWPFRPIRFLSLLPLSHMFGQALSMFFPPLVNAATVFTNEFNPDQIIEQTQRHRITLIVTVPRVLQLLRERVSSRLRSATGIASENAGLAARVWRHRDVHRLFGWRFCGFVLGGAPLDPELEAFWQRLGYAVVQGYGLTETAPIVAWNHPFKIKHGTVGRPIEGVELRIADDGEILVKGPIVSQGYLNAPEETRAAFEGGWFHTGDVGSFDDSGHLVIRGRKKDLIATPEGLKVFPDDVERVLDAIPGVRESAIVGRQSDHEESVHAVLVLEPGADKDAIIAAANLRLEPHQRIRTSSIWTAGPLPRTEPLRKLKRSEIRRWLLSGGAVAHPAGPPRADPLEEILAGYTKGQPVGPDATLAQLGISSLDRVELMMAIEERTGVKLDEVGVSEARTLDDLRRLAREETPRVAAPFPFPSWNRWRIACAVRNVSQPTWLLPMTHLFFRLRVDGREHVPASGPVVFAANHQSHFDTPVILSALPPRWRRAIAVAMWKEYFDAYFLRRPYSRVSRLTKGLLYYLLAEFFNAFPLPQTDPGARHTVRYMGDLVSDGWSILIFPEGSRTEHGEIGLFQAGVGLLGAKLHVPVVPVRLEGVDRVLYHTWRWPRRGDVRVTFGEPLTLEGTDYVALAGRVRDAVTALQPGDARRRPKPAA